MGLEATSDNIDNLFLWTKTNNFEKDWSDLIPK